MEKNQTSDEKIKENVIEFGSEKLSNGENNIYLLTIIGEIEGHECLSTNTKTTKYEHVLPELLRVECSDEYGGILVIINSVGGDVESGLAIAEMIASLSKPVVTLVLGGSHSIALPLAISGNYSFIVPTGTMVIHPVRMNGMFIGAPQTYEYFKKIQDRINEFVSSHCEITKERFSKLMLETTEMSKDVGSILVGQQAVNEKIIDSVGGVKEAIQKLKNIIVEYNKKK